MVNRLLISMLLLSLSLGLLLPGLSGVAQAEEATKDDAAAIAKLAESYPLQTCVVTGEKLGGEMGKPIDYLYQGRLVRFCCKGCIKAFNKEPAKYLKLIDDAAAKAKTGAGEIKTEGKGPE